MPRRFWLVGVALLWLVGTVVAAEPIPVVDAPKTTPNEEFTFGPGDKLSLQVYRHEELNADLTVAPDGTITVPLLGRIEVAGRSYTTLVHVLESGWRAYYTDASVAVNVTEVRSRKAFVVGEVANPSTIALGSSVTVLEALLQAGGIHPDARTDNVLLVRGTSEATTLYVVDVEAVMGGDLRQNVRLENGDILVVPSRTIVNVERFFRRAQGILSPFLSGSQMYRNVTLVGSLEDARGPEQ